LNYRGVRRQMSISAKFSGDGEDAPVSYWTAGHVAVIAGQPLPEAPLIDASHTLPLLPESDLWDLWPVQNPDGSVAKIAGGELWMVLSAPRMDDPDMRHDVARIRLLFRRDGFWQDRGLLFPDELNPGTREWSGSARYDASHGTITTYFTASGRRGEGGHSFEQRLFETSGLLDLSQDLPVISDWSIARPVAPNDGNLYVDVRIDQGVPGNINGFRDPYWLRDPADGRAYILFTGSQARSLHSHNGVVGLARAIDGKGEGGFELLPPIINADGVCNEMERPHLVIRDGLYYLFWSSQNSVFAADGPKGPSGLYGMVGPSIFGPYEPLNGTGLVITNPAAEPRQAYCWQVLDTLEVYSFIDHWGLNGRDITTDPALRRQQFGGTIAPVLKIAIEGRTTRLLGLA
jgi:levansucrase